MPENTVELDQVSKKYRLRRGWHVTSLREEMARLGRRLLFRPVPPREEFWALRDVSFSLQRGDVLGLVGLNGAGKSTLLKILSRVTVPTAGSFQTQGRLGALIEIGAGFHPELSGRENLFLNGAIMGMSRREVQAKFDRIVAFAEVERFIDTPIKHYSSGMQMRLGFAVAAHTDPDILLIDEILAVGDASFQAKCLNKLAELKQQDKTIILVSHNVNNILDHSKSVLWIDAGRIRMLGDPQAVVDAYQEHVTAQMEAGGAAVHFVPGDAAADGIAILDVALRDGSERAQTHFQRGETVTIDITYTARAPVPGGVLGVAFQDVHGYPLGAVLTDPDSLKIAAVDEPVTLRLTLRPLVFNRGTYDVSVYVSDPVLKKYYAYKRRAARIVVEAQRSGAPDSSGHIYYPHRWEVLK